MSILLSLKKMAALGVCALLLYACDSGSNKEGELRRRIREASSDGQVSAEEQADLLRFAKENADVAKYADCAALQGLVQSVMEKRGVPGLPDCAGGGTANTNPGGSSAFNVYVENSASMFGYMQGNTDFRESLMDLPSRLVGKQKTGSFFFINDQTYPATKDYSQFVGMLTREVAGGKDYGNTAKSSNTRLDDMLQRISNDAVRQKVLSIFASDCIFDVNGKTPQSELPNVKFKIKAAMQNLKRSGDYGVWVLRFTSLFDGNYYDCKDGKTVLKGVQRPFFMWIVGPADELRTFLKDYNMESVRGFKNQVFFYNSDRLAESYYYSFLERTRVKGSIQRPTGKTDRFVAAESARQADDKTFEVAVVVDLSKLPVSADYLGNASNWSVQSDKADPFRVVSVEPVSPASVHNNDKRFLGTATHILVLQTDRLSSGLQRLTVTLNKQLPSWIAASSSDDDTKILTQLDKTFGIRYLLEGANEAFDEPGSQAVHCRLRLEITK